MRGLRKLIACALVAVITIGVLASCGETQAPPEAEGDGSDEEQAAEPHLSYDAQIPVIDGSVSAEALADAFYGSLEGGAAGLRVSFSGTDPAMEKLVAYICQEVSPTSDNHMANAYKMLMNEEGEFDNV